MSFSDQLDSKMKLAEENFHLKNKEIKEIYKPINPIHEETEEYMETHTPCITKLSTKNNQISSPNRRHEQIITTEQSADEAKF